jgi:hypothetical protein
MAIVSAAIGSRSSSTQPSGHQKNPFFIFGCPRSGTSLLSAMLGMHPRLAIPGESHLYDNIYPIVERHGDLDHARRARVLAEILRSEFLKKWSPAPSMSETLDAVTRPDFHGLVDALLRSWASQQGKSRWGEKTPQHTLYWHIILAGFPDAQVIHMVRDGRDVVLSYRSVFFGPKHIYPLALRWNQYLATAEEARAFLREPAFLQVRYEDLVAAPEEELRRICAFLGEEFSPAMLAYHRERRSSRIEKRNAQNLGQPVMSDNTGKWRTQLTGRELRIVEAVAGDSLERYGYERALDNPSISRWEALSCRYLESPPRRLSSVLRNQQAHRLILEKLRLRLALMC